MNQNDQANATQPPNVDLRCEVCGQFGAVRVGDRALCQDCYTGSGSCCPEFGKDDLWTFPEEQSKESNRSSNPQ